MWQPKEDNPSVHYGLCLSGLTFACSVPRLPWRYAGKSCGKGCMLSFATSREEEVKLDWSGCADAGLSSVPCVSGKTCTWGENPWVDGSNS